MKPAVSSPSMSWDIRRLCDHDYEELWDPKRKPNVFIQFQNALAFFERLVDRSCLRVMDVGCAKATLALKLAEKGHEVFAIDLREDFIDFAKLRYTHGNIKFIVAEASTSELPRDIDLVFCNQMIEHTVYPVKLIENLARTLSSVGKIIITTPNQRYFRNKLPTFSELGNPSDYEQLQFTADGQGHFFAFTEEELRSCIARAGLRVQEVLYFETPLISGHCKLRLLQKYFSNISFWQNMERVALKLFPFRARFCQQIAIIATR